MSGSLKTGQKLKTKEDFLILFNQFTNNIFEGNSEEMITQIKSFNLHDTTAKKKILKSIIDPINKRNQLDLEDSTINMITPGRDIAKNTKKLSINLSLKHKKFYLTDLFSADQINTLLIAVRSNEEFVEKYSMIYRIIQLIEDIDLDKDDATDRINKIDSEYSILIIDITKEVKKHEYNWRKSVISIKPGNKFIILLRANTQQKANDPFEQIILPVYVLDHNDPRKSKFFLTKDELNAVTKGNLVSKLSALDITQEESKVQESKSESESSQQSTATKSPMEETTSKMPKVIPEPQVEDLTQGDDEVDESKEEVKTESKEETASKMPQVPSRPLVEDLTQGDHEGDESKVDLTVDKSKEEVKTDLEESKSDTILKDNPYDKNQFLRPIYFKELPGKKFLQGRANPYIKKTCYNIYEDKSDNKLVGLLEYTSIGDDIKVNVNWCSNYSPN